MTFYKLLGSTFLVASALLFSTQAQRLEKEKLKQTEAFILLIKFIKKQIDCFCIPIYKILQKADASLLEKCGLQASDIKVMPLDCPFEWLLSCCDIYVDGEAVELLRRFSSELGKSYRSEQIKSCEYYISELEGYKRKLETELPKKRKLRIAISLCASLSLVLLML